MRPTEFLENKEVLKVNEVKRLSLNYNKRYNKKSGM